jgi:hypothetical protein
VTRDTVESSDLESPGDSVLEPNSTVEPASPAAEEDAEDQRTKQKRPAKKTAKVSKARSKKEVEPRDLPSTKKWAAWVEYPGSGDLTNARSTTNQLNTLVSAALVAHGLGEYFSRLGVDGNWWSTSQEALVKFQESNGSAESGVVGPETWDLLGQDTGPTTGLDKIFETDGIDNLEGGSSSDLALYVQSLLILNGHGRFLQGLASRDWSAGSILALRAARAAGKEQ